MSRWPGRVALALGVLGLSGAGCEREAFVGADRAGFRDAGASTSGRGGAPDSPDAGVGGTAGGKDAHVCQQTLCQGHQYACGNCEDDDHDGLVDMDDPDCLGPCHNAEDTFYGSIPGQAHGGCASDCYFDQDSGFGNDGCLWSSACDALAPEGAACAYDPATKLPRGGDCATLASSQAAECQPSCMPLTPNGCDCFGCCEIPAAPTPVWVGSTDASGAPSCDLAHVGDPARCHPCTQVPSCLNPCDTCERCVGKTTLPSSCSQGSTCPAPVCPGDHPCGADCLPACPSGQACVTGCCVSPPR